MRCLCIRLDLLFALLDFVSLSVWLDLYLHRRKRSGCRDIRQGTKRWLKLALVGADLLKVSNGLCGFLNRVGHWLLVGWLVFGGLIDVSSLVSCCLTQHSHTHYPLSLSLLASVGTRVRVTAFASVLARRGSLDSGSLDSLTRRRGRTNLVTLLLVRCETVGKLSLTDFLSHR